MDIMIAAEFPHGVKPRPLRVDIILSRSYTMRTFLYPVISGPENELVYIPAVPGRRAVTGPGYLMGRTTRSEKGFK